MRTASRKETGQDWPGGQRKNISRGRGMVRRTRCCGKGRTARTRRPVGPGGEGRGHARWEHLPAVG